jgi:hypothetical protein
MLCVCPLKQDAPYFKVTESNVAVCITHCTKFPPDVREFPPDVREFPLNVREFPLNVREFPLNVKNYLERNTQDASLGSLPT